jgi:UDPglucose 6-dehydrogenase
MMKSVIGFAGMTHLGLNSAVAVAERGFNVICFDENKETIEKLKSQNLSIVEPNLDALLAKNIERIQFTHHLQDLNKADVIYIAPDVPTDHQGHSDISGIQQLIKLVATHLNSAATLVVLSQVPPGFTREIQFPQERLFYQVETLVFGQAMDRALNPERYIVGCHDPKKALPTHYLNLLGAFQCPILPMRYESAELAKISINCCLVASVSVANTLSELCEKISADWSEILPALKLDKRIGQYSYLAPGLGIAGGNLERDLTTVLKLSDAHGTDTSVISAWIKNSQYRRDWVLRILHQEILTKKSNPKIAILGLAYKEETNSIKNSPSVALIESLQSYSVKAYDPVVTEIKTANVVISSSMIEAIATADVVIIMTPWSEFKTLAPEDILTNMSGRAVIDPYKVLNGSLLQAKGLDYYTLGKGFAA